MDTSGLASSLSLAAALFVFLYGSAAGYRCVRPDELTQPAEHNSRLFTAYRAIRYGSLLAVVISFQALLVSQEATAVSIQASATLGLALFLIGSDRLAKSAISTHPKVVSTMVFPLHGLLSLLLPRKKHSPLVSETTGTGVINGHSDGVDQAEVPPVVITEEEQANLDIRERSMIRSILKLDEISVRGVMVPRVDMIAVDVVTSLPEVASSMLEHGHSRIPVFEGTIDHVIGVVYSRDLLPFLVEPKEHPPLTTLIRPAYFIPESKLLDDLLKELQEKRLQMAIVVDEYGGVEGLVTLEDLIEEIVGEIEDEFSRSLEPRVVPMPTGELVVDARVTLDYISGLLAIPLEHEDVDTVGGLVYSSLGKMPQVGDQIVVDGLTIEVISLLGRRINKLKLSRRIEAHQEG